MPSAYVFFACIPESTSIDGRAAGLVSRLTNSPINHVSVGDGEVVLDVRLRRSMFVPHDVFFVQHPYLWRMIEVPVPRKVTFPEIVGRGATEVIRSYSGLLNGNPMDGWNCLSVSFRTLIDSGFSLVPNILTPEDLHWHLKELGHRVVDLFEPRSKSQNHLPRSGRGHSRNAGGLVEPQVPNARHGRTRGARQ